MTSTNTAAKPKVDRRVLKTRKAIEDAFERLIVNTEYDKITVSALANEANINRKTFYLHYKSVDDVLDSMAQSFAQESMERLTSQDFFNKSPLEVDRAAQAIGEMYREGRLLHPQFMIKLPIKHLINAAQPLWEGVIANERKRRGLPPLEGLNYYVQFFLGGMLTAYENWYNAGGDTSFNEVAVIVAHALLNGVNGVLQDEHANTATLQ